ncbi:MAG: hypothetical protein WCT40_03200 [Candidatus Magasanikbacteria bacterium]
MNEHEKDQKENGCQSDAEQGHAPFENTGDPNVVLVYPLQDEVADMRHLGA